MVTIWARFESWIRVDWKTHASFRRLGKESQKCFQVAALALGELKMSKGNQAEEGLLTDVGVKQTYEWEEGVHSALAPTQGLSIQG